MTPTESAHRFKAYIEASGLALTELTPQAGSDLMQSFYAATVAEGCTSPSSDMLLFQWGTYDWGQGEAFELRFVRQFIELDADGEPRISQLSLVFQYPPSSELRILGEGHRWCGARDELPVFAKYIHESPPCLALERQAPPSVGLSHFYV